jgi:hypothetical protein
MSGGMTMAKVLKFPQVKLSTEAPFKKAMAAIESRFGVSFQEYIGVNGQRSAETQAKMQKALQKETFDIKGC